MGEKKMEAAEQPVKTPMTHEEKLAKVAAAPLWQKIAWLSKPLASKDLEIRVGQSGGKNGRVWASLLIYQTARVATARFNAIFGGYWKTDYAIEQSGAVVCTISIYDPESNQWISRSNIGTQSNIEKEKGAYSDALKRAATAWGLGLELYTFDNIFVDLKPGEYTEYNGKIRPKLSGWHVAYSGGEMFILDGFGVVRHQQRVRF